MGLTVGIVGLPNVGKSTLFNALTSNNILAANYPFATIEPNVGMVAVPDKRLDFLNEMYNPKSLVPTSFEFTDIAGLVKGASTGEGLGNKFLSHIREVDAICEVVRCFDDDNIIHVSGTVDPIRDIETISVELMLSDLEIVTSRLARIEKKAVMSRDKEALKEVELLKKIRNGLEENIPVRHMDLNEEELLMIKSFALLSSKPIVYMANIEEKDILNNNKYVDMVKEYALKDQADVIVVCAKIEEELSTLALEDRELFLDDLGISESGLDKLIKALYGLLGLKTFFTSGTDEVRAWTFKNGMKAPECAGIIHSDFERGFIKAEVMSFGDLKELGSEKAVKEAGKLRLEGKDYIMQDGDICYFRFNVTK